MNEAFVYRWRRLDGSWYIGYHKGTPDDGYICSSDYAKPDIQENPENWSRKILRFGTKKAMLALERRILTKLNARENPKSFNRSNGYPPYDIQAALKRRQNIQVKVVGTQTKIGIVPKIINDGMLKITGQYFEYHYLQNFFRAVEERDANLIKSMIPGIALLFGIRLELHYD
jgi:hypothetical protein